MNANGRPNPWQAFRQNNRGRGFTLQQLSQMYRQLQAQNPPPQANPRPRARAKAAAPAPKAPPVNVAGPVNPNPPPQRRARQPRDPNAPRRPQPPGLALYSAFARANCQGRRPRECGDLWRQQRGGGGNAQPAPQAPPPPPPPPVIPQPPPVPNFNFAPRPLNIQRRPRNPEPPPVQAPPAVNPAPRGGGRRGPANPAPPRDYNEARRELNEVLARIRDEISEDWRTQNDAWIAMDYCDQVLININERFPRSRAPANLKPTYKHADLQLRKFLCYVNLMPQTEAEVRQWRNIRTNPNYEQMPDAFQRAEHETWEKETLYWKSYDGDTQTKERTMAAIRLWRINTLRALESIQRELEPGVYNLMTDRVNRVTDAILVYADENLRRGGEREIARITRGLERDHERDPNRPLALHW